MNLITNAHHAMHGNTSARRLTHPYPVRAADSRRVLEVADTGPGIPPEVLERIFEPFFTTSRWARDRSRASPLPGIVEGHGGTIRVESKLGERRHPDHRSSGGRRRR